MKLNEFLEIRAFLEDYKGGVDEIVAAYRAELEKAQATYSQAVFAEKHAQAIVSYTTKLDDKRHLVAVGINRRLDSLQEALKAWITEPVEAGQLQLITALDTVGVQLSEAEIEALAETVQTNYFAAKITGAIAQKSGINPPPEMPRLDDYLKLLKDVRTECNMFLRYYVGGTPLATELLAPEYRSPQLCAAAATCSWQQPDSAVNIGALCWPGDRPAQKIKALNIENAADAEIAAALDALIGAVGPDQLQGRIEYLLKRYPLLKPVLLASKYKGFLTLPPEKR